MTAEVTDAQVFAAMGWEWVKAGERGNMLPSWYAPDGKRKLHPPPPVMSNPSSPEAWAAVPMMLEWLRDADHEVMIHHIIGNLASVIVSPGLHQTRFEYPLFLPAAIGQAIVRATSEEGAG